MQAAGDGGGGGRAGAGRLRAGRSSARVTLPNVKWGLLYGVILCNARAMGEFGAVSVVSGHIRGLTNTLPLHVEILYNEYHFQAAFARGLALALPGPRHAGRQELAGVAHARAPRGAERAATRALGGGPT